MYNIKTIDFKQIESVSDLHLIIANLLNFPVINLNNWDTFLSMITGSTEPQTNVIFYNFNYFWDIYETDARKLLSIIDQYNNMTDKFLYRTHHYENLMQRNFYFQFDSLDDLKTNELKTIFITRPYQFGLRGDNFFWDELEIYFKDHQVPETEQQLIDQIHHAMIQLTGRSTIDLQIYYVEKYNYGGMSRGLICSEWWEQEGIPLFIGRYRKIKNNN